MSIQQNNPDFNQKLALVTILSRSQSSYQYNINS
jgi:hypothetical protein